jgi:hypothetical protein
MQQKIDFTVVLFRDLPGIHVNAMGILICPQTTGELPPTTSEERSILVFEQYTPVYIPQYL